LSNQRVESVKKAFANTVNVSAIGYGELKNSSSLSRRVDVIISFFDLEKEIKNKPIIVQEINNIVKNDNVFSTKKEVIIGETYLLEGILFKGAEDVFLDESFIELKKLLTFMKSNNYKIKLLGHICCTTNGKDGFNKITRNSTLSIDRAKAVYNYLIENGIEKNRMSYVGLAGKFPTGKAVKYDRRVEIEILSLD